MGLFKKNDELFEIMSKRRAAGSGKPPGGGSTTDGSSGETTQIRRRLSTTSIPVRRPTQSGFGPRLSRPSNEPDLFDLDGDALVVVDDGWAEATNEEQGQGKTFAIRPDTLVVGAFLTAGLIAAAFLFGRSSTGPEAEVKVAVVATEQAPAPSATPPVSVAPSPIALAVGAKSTEPVARSMPKPEVPTSTQASETPTPASTPEPSATHQATTVPASSPKAVAKGKYVLVVCTTRPNNAVKLANWLNTAPKSPIFGRGDLEAFFTRKGVVRIRGFAQRETRVLSQVKATNDPLGGSGTFHTAYYKRS